MAQPVDMLRRCIELPQARLKLFALLLAIVLALWHMMCQTCLLCLQYGPHCSPSTVSMHLGSQKLLHLLDLHSRGPLITPGLLGSEFRFQQVELKL